MHCEAVEDQHVSGVDMAADPLVAEDCIGRNRRNVTVLMLVLLDAKTMRTFKNPQ